MLRGYRSILAAIAGLTALFVALGTGAYYGSLYSPDHKQYQAVASDQAGNGDYAGPSQSLPDISGLPGPVERAIANPKPATGQDHEIRDLAAQEASALWAFWMVVASFASVLITAVGTAFLYKQIVLTREAVEDTGKATEAMLMANEIADRNDRNSTMALRPWFSPTGITWKFIVVDETTFIEIRIIWKNFGGTPTRNLVFIETPFWGVNTLQLEKIQTNFAPDSVRSIVGPGQEIWSQQTRLTLAEIDSIFSGAGRLFIYGHAKYQDIFGDDEHMTSHLWEIGIIRHTDRPLKGDNVQEITWTVAGRVNHAT